MKFKRLMSASMAAIMAVSSSLVFDASAGAIKPLAMAATDAEYEENKMFGTENNITTITNNVDKIESISFSNEADENNRIYLKDTVTGYTLNVVDNNGNEMDGTEFEWTSNFPDVVTVDESGKITIVGVGESIVKAVYKQNTELFDMVSISVEETVKSITFRNDSIIDGTLNVKFGDVAVPTRIEVNGGSMESDGLEFDVSSDNTDVVSFDENGDLTFVGAGEANVKVVYKDDSSISCTFKVVVAKQDVDFPISAPSISGALSEADALEKAKAAVKVTYTNYPGDYTISVDFDDETKARYKATVVLSEEGAKNYSINGLGYAMNDITYKITGVTLSDNTLSRVYGSDTYNIISDVKSAYATCDPYEILWKSSDENVAAVEKINNDMATVTFKGVGTATLTAYLKDDESIFDECVVTVKSNEPEPTGGSYSGKADISETEMGNWTGWLAINATDVAEGDIIRIKFTVGDESYHQLKVVKDVGENSWEALSSIKNANQSGAVDLQADGVYEIVLDENDAAAISTKGLAIQGYDVTVTEVSFNVIKDDIESSGGYHVGGDTIELNEDSALTSTENEDGTKNLLTVFRVDEEAKSCSGYEVTVARADGKKTKFTIDTYYSSLTYKDDNIVHEGIAEAGTGFIVMNLINVDPAWGTLNICITPIYG